MLKKVTNRFVSCVMCVMILLTLFQCGYAADITDSASKAAADEIVAEAKLGETLESVNFKEVSMGEESGVVLAERDGRTCWLLDRNQDPGKLHLNMILSDSIKENLHDGSEFELEVEYYNFGSGFLRVAYDAWNFDNKDAGMIYTEKYAEGWRTEKYTLKDAEFNCGIDGKYDLRLSVAAYSSRVPLSNASIAVGRVRLVRKVNKNKIYLTATNDQPGHTYRWFDDEKIIHNKFENLSEERQTVNVNYRLVSEKYEIAFEKNEVLTFEPRETKNPDLDFGEMKRCDVYKYIVKITSEDGGIDTEFTPFEIAVLKTDPDGILNKDLMFTAHFRYSDEINKQELEVLKLGNVGGFRSDFHWHVLEKTKGVYEPKNIALMPVLEEAKKMGIEYLAVLCFGNPNYISDGSLPHTEEQLQGWENYSRAAAEILDGVTDRYEVYNEPNASSFNSDIYKYGGAVYEKMAERSWKAIKSVNPNAKIGGPVLCAIEYEHPKQYFMDAMDAGLANYTDACSLHPYNNGMPESGTMVDTLQWYKDQYKGKKDDIEIWNTELGYTSTDGFVGNEDTKGIYNCRNGLMYKSRGLGDMFVLYNFEQMGTNDLSREDRFGHVSSGYYPIEGKYFVPTRSYVMIAAYNYIMTNTDAISNHDSTDGNVRVSKFRSHKFDKDIVSLHTLDGEYPVTLKLNTDKVECYDVLGNSRTVKGINGEFTFAAGNAPQYIIGDIPTVEILNNTDNTVLCSTVNVEGACGGDVRVDLENRSGQEMTIDVTVPSCAEVKQITQFEGEAGAQKGSVLVQNNASVGKDWTLEITVRDKNGEAAEYLPIKVSSVEKVQASLTAEMMPGGDVNRWMGTIHIRNLAATSAAKGYVEFKAPEDFVKLGKIQFEAIPANSIVKLEFEMPNIVKKGEYEFQYDIVLVNGERYSQTDKIDFTLASYASTKPVIDGKLENGEWNKNTAMYAENVEQVKHFLDWGGKDDISGYGIVMWDEDNFYFCAEVTDDVFDNKQPAVSNWNGDCVQLGILYGEEGLIVQGQAGTQFHEINIAKNTVTNTVSAYRSISQENYHPLGEYKGGELAVERNGNKTVYEFRMPWEDLLLPGQQPKEGDKLGFSFLFADSDGNNRRGWIEYAGGIGETKNSNLFTHLTLLPKNTVGTMTSDSGKELAYECDFEGYHADYNSKIYPDENWGTFDEKGYEWTNRTNFGSFYDTANKNTCLKIGQKGEPQLFFGEMLRSGNLRISFDIKQSSDTKKTLAVFYDGANADDARTLDISSYSHAMWFNRYQNELHYNPDNWQSWNSEKADIDYDPTEWHRVDIVTSGIAEEGATANYYIDGQIINKKPISISETRGLKAFAIRVDSIDGYENDGAYVLIDNVSVERTFDEIGLRVNLLNRSVLADGTLHIKLSEAVEPSLMVNENILIANTETGKRIVSFYIENVDDKEFIIRFEPELSDGEYILMFNKLIVGKTLSKPMTSEVTFYSGCFSISSYTHNTHTATVYGRESKNCLLIFAAYDKDNMPINIDAVNINFNGEEEKKVVLDSFNPYGSERIEGYLWESDRLNPLCDKFKVVTDSVNANNREDIVFCYDFEDYNKPFSQGNMDGTGPDENWTLFNNQKNFGSYTEENNTAMKLGLNGGPALKLGRVLWRGSVRVSFDFKGSDYKHEKLLVRFMSDTDASGTYTLDDYWANMFWFNAEQDEKAYYFEKPSKWAKIEYSGSCSMNQWHNAEIEITDFAGGKATINYYLDKNKVNAEPISADMEPIEVLNFMVENNYGDEWYGNDNRYFLIDNLKVEYSK